MHLLALSAFPMWRSNLLFFPIGQEKHWFTLVVCLKERAFAFLDSLYGAKDHFHLGIHDKLIENFITIWDQFVTPILRTRIDFENFDIVYPTVPQQNNWEDCGVFTIMYLKHRTPRTPIGNMFGAADVDNIRIRLANELYFSGFNSVDKTFVTHFFDDVKA
ncbi:sentrin-specific protease 5 isoform X4 [Triticum aestivum]|nr:sentrin-specific protease 5-like isoform X4 [Triticum aestivum]XP_044387532.1 sentrin-specific protease 5-like isoform X4 [Triticum aestivum]XP_044387533.1 sentrin-specific protease 5-like isoform X4 [Triticum aestivum]XP_044387534.1 sentrin-specific protease 5-like isoform X4 [Triticum aestivum]